MNDRLSNAEIIERAHVINEAMLRWKDRPHAGGAIYGDGWDKPDRARSTIEYWAGRSYTTGEVVGFLSKRFDVQSSRAVFGLAHAYMYGAEVTGRVISFLEQTHKDYEAGARLPPFVLAAYTELKSIET